MGHEHSQSVGRIVVEEEELAELVAKNNHESKYFLLLHKMNRIQFVLPAVPVLKEVALVVVAPL